MARIVGYDQENGRRVYLNLEQVIKIAHHQAGGSLVTGRPFGRRTIYVRHVAADAGL